MVVVVAVVVVVVTGSVVVAVVVVTLVVVAIDSLLSPEAGVGSLILGARVVRLLARLKMDFSRGFSVLRGLRGVVVNLHLKISIT